MTLNTTGPISLGGNIAGQSIALELGGNGALWDSLLFVRAIRKIPV